MVIAFVKNECEIESSNVGVLFFTGQALVAQEVKKDTTSEKEKTIDTVVILGV